MLLYFAESRSLGGVTEIVAINDNTLREAFPVADFSSGRLLVRAGVWDCVGDFMLSAAIAARSTPIAKEQVILLVCSRGSDGKLKYYSTESIIRDYLALKEKGWLILTNQADEAWLVECPCFDLAIAPGAGGQTLSSLDYAHPIDAKIISCLNLPGIRQILGSVVSTLTDLNLSQVISTGIPVTEQNFPEIHDIVRHCSARLGIRSPYVVVSNAVAMNAFTTGSDAEPYIILGNTLVHVMNREQLRFIIGHECGHIAMGHVVYHSFVATVGNFSQALPLLGPMVYNTISLALSAWSRRSEITADRAGLLCCEELSVAENALVQIETGMITSTDVDVSDYVKVSKRYRRGSVLRRVGEYTKMHPPLTKRIEALRLFRNSELFYAALNRPRQGCPLDSRQLEKKTEELLAVLGKE